LSNCGALWAFVWFGILCLPRTAGLLSSRRGFLGCGVPNHSAGLNGVLFPAAIRPIFIVIAIGKGRAPTAWHTAFGVDFLCKISVLIRTQVVVIVALLDQH